MNTLSILKKIGSAILICLCAAGSALAQQGNAWGVLKNNPPPTSVAAPVPKDPIPYPDVTWSYALPAGNATSIPTIDKNAALYLPYLPWIGQNLAMLVNYADFNYQQHLNDINGNTIPYNAAHITAANNLLNQIREENMKKAAAQTAAEIQKQLTFDASKNSFNYTKLALLPGTDIYMGDNPPSNSQFNADSLLGVMGYPTENGQQNKEISELIAFLTNMTSAYPNPGLSGDAATRIEELKRGDVQSYLLTVRTLAAMQSLAMSNYNFLSRERAIIPGLGKQIGMPKDDASQLEVERYLIDRRLNNPDWYKSMNNSSHATLERETLFVLTELQRQMFELRMLNERMLATMTSMQMALTQLNRTSLDVQAQNVRGQLKKAAEESSQSSQ